MRKCVLSSMVLAAAMLLIAVAAYATTVTFSGAGYAGSVTLPATVAPGGTASVSVDAANVSGKSLSTKFTVSLSVDGISVGSESFSATVAAGASYSKSVSVTVPKELPAGTYKVTVTATDSLGSVSASASITVS